MRIVTLLPGMAFVIILFKFYTKLTFDWFISAVSFIQSFRGQTSLNYFWAGHLYKSSKSQSKCTKIWLANSVSFQTGLYSFSLLTVIMWYTLFTTVQGTTGT